MKKMPDITINIRPSNTVPYTAIHATWRSQDGTQRHRQVVLHDDEMKTKRQRVIDQMLSEIITLEEALHD